LQVGGAGKFTIQNAAGKCLTAPRAKLGKKAKRGLLQKRKSKKKKKGKNAMNQAFLTCAEGNDDQLWNIEFVSRSSDP